MKLEDYRDLLDQIDDQILTLLQERATIVKRVGELKSSTGVERIYAPHREREILSRLETQNRGQFPPTRYTRFIPRLSPPAVRSKDRYPSPSLVLLVALVTRQDHISLVRQ